MSSFGRKGDFGFGSNQASFQPQSNQNTVFFGSSVPATNTGKNEDMGGLRETQKNFGFGQQAFNSHNHQQMQPSMFGSSPNVVTNSFNSGGFSSGSDTGGNSNLKAKIGSETKIRNAGTGTNPENFSNFNGGGSVNSFSNGRQTRSRGSSNQTLRNPFGEASKDDRMGGLTFGSSSNVVKTNAKKPSSETAKSSVPSAGWDNPAPKLSTNGGISLAGDSDQPSLFAANTFGAASGSTKSSPDGGTNPFQSTFSNMQQVMSQNQGTFRFTENAMGERNESTADVSRLLSDSIRPQNRKETVSNDNQGNISLDVQAQRLKAKMEKRKLLEARIEEKKRKLEKRKQQQSSRSVLNATAAPFIPKSKTDSGHGRNDYQNAQEKDSSSFREWRKEEQSNSKTHYLLPRGIKATTNSQDKPSVRKEREDLENAVSLVGTCEHMCPDDELLRREGENDVQLLEIPLPGTLHPGNWTLRNTMIKRFRRSAADYKLDVPEWVRPPDVLERVCGYLEEWVLDRDRQGPDPRFPRDQTPQPLDVYQFIWNRTRMIRKDFTLQNFVGSGGNCDARAVRCHERIARWHAMCEHQLSHIPEFTKMQSQQNIQELGQTMKTLNQFYDDDLNRSMIEVPDENSNETRKDMTSFSHGCSIDAVQGVDPSDYDGSSLNNVSAGTKVMKRLIGKHAVNSPNHGTAEPEMRGLYILLTINNDGGMEVLKYAARLFKDRPNVYHSKPVQLALDIYKAKKELNYVRFFQILRSPNTPYLFGCIMFKYVEVMRKAAIRIMSKTYGARRKDTGESFYDGYPLERFRDLLCYENDDEARYACKHYNIAVKLINAKSSTRIVVEEFILWRKSDFKDPIDPDKGHKLSLQPRKMMKTIESKLLGATRLGICRGEVSFGDETLTSVPRMAEVSNNINSSCEGEDSPSINDVRSVNERDPASGKYPTARANSLFSDQTTNLTRIGEQSKGQEERILNMDENKTQNNESIRVQKGENKQRRAKQISDERNAKLIAEAARKAEELNRLKIEKIRKQKEDETRKRLEIEARKNLEIEAQRKMKNQRKLEIRRKLEIEAQKNLEIEKRREREKEELRKRQERELAEERQNIEFETQKRKAQEEARRQAAAAAAAQALELKKLKEAEDQRKKQIQQNLFRFSRKALLLKRWDRRLSWKLHLIQNSKNNLLKIDPTFSRSTLYLNPLINEGVDEEQNGRGRVQSSGTRNILENILRSNVLKKVDMSRLVLQERNRLRNLEIRTRDRKEVTTTERQTLLLKLGILVQRGGNPACVSELICRWIELALQTGKIQSFEDGFSTAQSLAVFCSNVRDTSDCDVVLCIVPPGQRKSFLVPEERSVILQLDKDCSNGTAFSGNGVLRFHPEGGSVESYESTLSLVCETLARVFLQHTCVRIERKDFFSIATQAIRKSLWMPFKVGTNNEDGVIDRVRITLAALAEEVASKLEENKGKWLAWPPNDFLSSKGMIDGYFSRNQGLPANWTDSLSKQGFGKKVSLLLQIFDGSLRDSVAILLGRDATQRWKDDCARMLSKRQFRGCLEKALLWRDGRIEMNRQMYVYCPHGLVEALLAGTANRLSKLLSPDGTQNCYAATRLQTNNSGGARVPVGLFDLDDRCEKVDGNHNKESFIGDEARLESIITNNCTQNGSSKKRKKPEGRMLQRPYETTSQRKKLQTGSSSLCVTESSAFTKKLEGLLHGDMLLDVHVGKKTLSAILTKQKNFLPESIARVQPNK